MQDQPTTVAPGANVLVSDEAWRVRKIERTSDDGKRFTSSASRSWSAIVTRSSSANSRRRSAAAYRSWHQRQPRSLRTRPADTRRRSSTWRASSVEFRQRTPNCTSDTRLRWMCSTFSSSPPYSRSTSRARESSSPTRSASARHCPRAFSCPSSSAEAGENGSSSAAIQAGDPSRARVLCWLDDLPEQRQREEFPRLWNAYLRAHNLLQFLGEAYFVTTAATDFPYSELIAGTSAPSIITEPDIAWHAAIELLIDARYEGYARRYYNAGVTPPAGGYGVPDLYGKPLGPCAELAWIDARVALVAEGDIDPRFDDTLRVLREAGWQAFGVGAFADNPDKLRTLVDGGS